MQERKLTIHSNKKKYCLRCNQRIVEANYSGWEAFTEEGLTQPICVFCNEDTDDVSIKKTDNGS